MKWKLKPDNNWAPEQVFVWEQIRAKGKGRFLLSQGARIGAYWFAFFLFQQIFKFGFEKAFTNGPGLMISVLFASAAGLLIPFFNWDASEASYFKALQPEGQRDTFDYATRQRIVGWQKIKAEGLKRYILTRSCAFVVLLLGFTIGTDLLEGDGLGYENFWDFAGDFVGYCATGVMSACLWWHIGEDFYRKACETESKRAKIENTNAKNSESAAIA